MTTSRKSFLSFAVACIVALMAATAAFASNSADTDFTFSPSNLAVACPKGRNGAQRPMIPTSICR